MAFTLPDTDQTALTARALAGDDEALGRVLARHERVAYNVAYRLLGSEADARDAVQEAFLQVVRAIRHDIAPPREVRRFRRWLLRVVATAALRQLRRHPAIPSVSVEVVADFLPVPGGLEPAGAAEDREARGDILRALLSLPATQRAALSLREYQGLSYAEIAAMLGVSHAAVETLLFRARRGFRAAYEGFAANPGPVGCPDLAPLLSAMIDDEVEPAAWAELSAHLNACRRCRQELKRLRRGRRLRALIPLLAPPAGWHATATAGATSGGLLANLAGLGAGKAAGAVVGAGLGVAVVLAPLPRPDPAALAELIAGRPAVASVGPAGPDTRASTPAVPAPAAEVPVAEAPAPPPVAPPRAATAPVPTRAAGPSRPDAGLARPSTDPAEPTETVLRFYRLLEQGEYEAVTSFWSDRMRAASPWDPSLLRDRTPAGQLTVRRAEVIALDEAAGRAAVAVEVLEVRGPPAAAPLRYVGTWHLVRGPAGWLLDESDIRIE
jgi:RNA polymerase sigma-70 factor (ECF subfamily)